MKKLYLIPTFALAASLANANVLINFHSVSAAYAPGGTTYNNFDFGADDQNPAAAFTSYTDAALVDSANAATGYTMDFSVSTTGFSNAGAAQSVYDTAKPATGFDWYVTSSASLLETAVFSGIGSATYVFDGFLATDSVTFQFVLGRSGTGTRGISLGESSESPADSLLDNVNTASAAYFVETTLTGATSYSFTAVRESTGDAASSVIGAAAFSVTPVPEPSTYALIGGILALGLVIVRRRLRG